MANDSYRVTSANGRRTFFAGTEDQCAAYVVANFPRLHVEPGSGSDPEPDAVVLAPDGSVAHFDGTDWHSDETDDQDDDATPALSANVATWRAYATAHGDEDAGSKSKRELIDQYTTETE